MLSRLLFAVLIVTAAGCASTTREPASAEGTGLDPNAEGKLLAAPKRTSHADPVSKQAAPFHGVRASDGEALPGYMLLDELSSADAICVAEDHDDSHHHWAELRILRSLLTRAEASGREVGVGMEMFERRSQPDLNLYLSRKAKEKELLQHTEWESSWGYDYALYRPVVKTARRRNTPVVGLNASRELAKKVARDGLRSLSEKEKKEVPHLNLHDEQHRALFDEATQDHPHHGKKRRLYAAQVLRDETMADTAASWLEERQPARQLLILAGANHCRASAIPARIRRRVDCNVVSVRPVLEDTGTDVQKVLKQFDYAFIIESQGGSAEE